MSILAPFSLTSDRGMKIAQSLVRLLFALLALTYFSRQPALFIALPGFFLWLMLAGYLAAHTLLLLRPLRGASLLPAMVDLTTLAVLVVLDPGNPPPTLALLIVAVLSSGMLHGLRRFLLTLAGAVLAIALALTVRVHQSGTSLDIGSAFLLATLAVCVLYFALILVRTQRLERETLAATWRDPETRLVSRAALSHTAGWLLPLHDRLSSPLTATLLAVDEPQDLQLLTDAVSSRLRRSDIAARYDGTVIAVLFPCTRGKDAEQVLHTLHEKVPGLRGALVSLADPDISLEQILHHLNQALPRSRQDGHWLVHATAME